jgi:hypothetical protein
MAGFQRLFQRVLDRGARDRPPVSAVVGVSVFDVGHLAVTLPHVLRQAQYPFAERVVVIDPLAQPGARNRTRGELAELEQILSAAWAADVIDRVVALDAGDAAQRRTLDRYFRGNSSSLLDEDPSICGTLASLDCARHDLVAWLHADLLFHASETSWVASGVDALLDDEQLWLAQTPSGPPSQSPRPLPRMLRRLARSWPRSERIASTAHFVCDRRRFYGRLRRGPVASGGSRKRLSDYLDDAAQRDGAFVCTVDDAWHVRPRTHAAPWTQWIEPLVRAVQRGELPPSQRDGWLHLEDAAMRSTWRRHLFGDGDDAPSTTASSRAPRIARVRVRRRDPGSLPISVILPIRNRAGTDVRNALASLAWQRGGRPWETIVVSHGSDPAIDAELRRLAVAADATLVTLGNPDDPWCKPLALNVGILATDPTLPFVMTMDADMMLADNMLEIVVAELRAHEKSIVLCQSSDLPEDCALPSDPTAIHAQFDELRRIANVRGTYGTGGIQAMPRSFLIDVRGYDEDMLWWGALDTDMVQRAEASGLKTSWVTDRTAMLHQWHPRKHRVLDGAIDADAAQSAWLRNHELMVERSKDVVRNRDGWGATIQDAMDG